MSNDYPLNVILVNQDDGNEMVSDINAGNYVFLHTGIKDKVCKMKITIELNDGETETTYVAEFDEGRNLVNEYVNTITADDLIMRLIADLEE